MMLFLVADVTAKQKNAAAKQNKMLICHVGNEAGPGGETYLDEPDCEPSDLNGYFCPDAGKIDLIVIAEKAAAKHLVNPSHHWDGISDYDPYDLGASGKGTEDSDGNGVDDGCEIPVENDCPCWDVIELTAVTAENQKEFLSCNSYNRYYPNLGMMQAKEGEVFLSFRVWNSASHLSNGQAGCTVYHEGNNGMLLTDQEAEICISQVYTRCAETGRPVMPE
jgi:hypothetical protein